MPQDDSTEYKTIKVLDLSKQGEDNFEDGYVHIIIFNNPDFGNDAGEAELSVSDIGNLIDDLTELRKKMRP